MTRIGRIIFVFSDDPDMPRFRLVVENGRVVLGCWRFSHWDTDKQRAVFERVS